MTEHNHDDDATANEHDDPLAELEGWLDEQLEGADPLPTTDEAELGELAREPLPKPDDANAERVATLERDPSHDCPEGMHWLDHYLAIQRDDLIACAASQRAAPEGSPSKPLKKALWAREGWLAVYPDTEYPFA